MRNNLLGGLKKLINLVYIMNLLLYFQVFNETVARDSYAGVKKWNSSAWHYYWSWCGNEHAFKIRQNDHQKQRSSQFGDAQCTRKQYQVCSVTIFSSFHKTSGKKCLGDWLWFLRRLVTYLYSLWLSCRQRSACCLSQRSCLVYFVDLIFCHQKFSAQEDLLGSIQKFTKIRIYKDRGCWPFWGAGVQNPNFCNVRLSYARTIF